MIESYKTNEFESEVLKEYFREFIKDRFYFRVRTLAIEFLTDNTTLNYKDASQTENLRGIVMRFSKITTQAKQDNIIRKYNSNTYKVIKIIK